MVFAGVSNGETLWALPNQASPEHSSDTSSPMGQINTTMSGNGGGDDLMADIDWVRAKALFSNSNRDAANTYISSCRKHLIRCSRLIKLPVI
jgi:hypothetical protein